MGLCVSGKKFSWDKTRTKTTELASYTGASGDVLGDIYAYRVRERGTGVLVQYCSGP